MKHEIIVPSNLMEIPLSRYQKFVKSAATDDSEFNRLFFVSCLTAIDINIVKSIKAKDFNEIYAHLINMFPTKAPYINRFKIDGLEFGAIPNLDDITTGEYADLDTYFRSWETMHKAMAVMFRPITESKKDVYSIEEYKGSDKWEGLMKFAPLGVALGMQVFFWTLSNDLLMSFQVSLTEMKKEMEKDE